MAEFNRRRIQIDPGGIPSAGASRLHDESGAATDVEIAHRLAIAPPDMRVHETHAFGPEPSDAIVVAADSEIANDLLIFGRRIDTGVMRFVERRIDVHEIAHAAADDRHVVLGELRLLRRGPARRTRARREKLVRNPAESRHERIDRMRALLNQRFVGCPRTKLADVDRLILGQLSIQNLH